MRCNNCLHLEEDRAIRQMFLAPLGKGHGVNAGGEAGQPQGIRAEMLCECLV
jgi:hypothetical protein